MLIAQTALQLELDDESTAAQSKVQSTTATDSSNPDYLLCYKKKHEQVLVADGSKKASYCLAQSEEQNKRKTFQKNLIDIGLKVDEKPASFRDDIVFVLVYATPHILLRQAAKLGLKKPAELQKHRNAQALMAASEPEVAYADGFRSLPINDENDKPDLVLCYEKKVEQNDAEGRQGQYISQPLSGYSNQERNESVSSCNSKCHFPKRCFSDAEKGMMVYDLLERTPFSDTTESDHDGNSEVGIEALLRNGVYKFAVQPHARFHPLALSNEKNKDEMTGRELLYKLWCSYGGGSLFYSPIETVRHYYGPQLAMLMDLKRFLFRFLLLLSSLIVFVIFPWAAFTFRSCPQINEVCSSLANEPVCPQCKSCDFTRVGDSCFNAVITHFADHYGVILTMFLMSVISAVFSKVWKRHESELSWNWKLQNFESKENVRYTIRLEKYGKCVRDCSLLRVQPWLLQFKYIRHAISGIVIVLLLLFTLCLIIILALLQNYFHYWMNLHNFSATVRNAISTGSSVFGGIANAVIVMLVNLLYTWVAKKLVNLESSKTQDTSQKSFCVKIFYFEFITYCSPVFYYSVIRGNITVKPLQPFFKLFQFDNCDVAGCVYDFSVHIVVMYCSSSLFKLIKLLCWQYIKRRRLRAKSMKKDGVTEVSKSYEKTYFLLPVNDQYFVDEYIKLTVDYFCILTCGSVTMGIFVLVVVVVQVIMHHVHGLCFVRYFRKPTPRLVKNIGVWSTIFDFVSWLAAAVCVFMIGFTSNLAPKAAYRLYYKQDTLSGFLNFTLAYSDVRNYDVPKNSRISLDLQANNITYCRYPSYRKPPCSLHLFADCDDNKTLSSEFWVVLSFRLGLVVSVIFVVYFIRYIIEHAFSDLDKDVQKEMKEEQKQADGAYIGELRQQHQST